MYVGPVGYRSDVQWCNVLDWHISGSVKLWTTMTTTCVEQPCLQTTESSCCKLAGQPSSRRNDEALFEEVLWQQTADDADNELDEHNAGKTEADKEGLLSRLLWLFLPVSIHTV